ncbi:Immune-responsive protein 1 [Caenispirillum salinarum AK4]|uniref:Immune-responsive protein 1 n=1 Tax=Caenispirillum salinarum AK4 TaxID=1238182 RepID=K9HNG5_9PROT|nr:MmgE/PrpD family protein [Caenispirillum salinarum]EKV31873.1 Immune-responsive protein 1 [Caenispirillum salinarum AK4]
MTDALAFLHDCRFSNLPEPVVRMAERCLLDLIGVAAAGRRTALSAIVHDFACRHMAAGDAGARLLLDGRRVSPAGAAFAGASTIDSFDAHDGHRLTKGHAGVAILPALLAYVDHGIPVTGREFLTSIVVGYEIATRAGIALHATAADYHTSGAWNAVACAALGARLMGLDAERTRHALGIAEYHGPRSPMMRCIDHPTMVKDGSGWGALAGVSAAYLAAEAFTGAPAATVEDPAQADLWRDLGTRWRILDQYLKPYPVCRWAQPAVEAALALQRQAGLTANAITAVRIHTFHQATRLAARAPETTEAAQYSTPFPVAAALVRGRVGADEITGDGLSDPNILRLSMATELVDDPDMSRRFPAERWARAALQRADGHWIEGEARTARGDPEAPLDSAEITRKFRALAHPTLGHERTALLEADIVSLAEDATDVGAMTETLFKPMLLPA